MSKRVKAIAAGFTGGSRIREGTIFFVDDKKKAKWFIDYPEGTKDPVAPSKEKQKVVEDPFE